MRSMSSMRGYSLVEVLATVLVLGLLLFAVGSAVTHVLDAEMLAAGRQNVLRSADELASRMAEEARSSTAVFVPSLDVLGQPNSGAGGAHEVDFFRKASDGSGTYVAYRHDASTGTVSRYEYAPGVGGAHVFHMDLMAERIGSFQAVRTDPGSIGGVVGGSNVQPVNIYYGTPELVGGNGIVTVAIAAGAGGDPPHRIDVHLASRAAPTDVSILVPSGSPPPTAGPSPTPITVVFLLTPPAVHPPHGPNHSGDPGNSDPTGGVHRPGVPGSATFLGNGAGTTEDWLSLYTTYNSLEDGVYRFADSNGSSQIVTISCDSGPCPRFAPVPVPTAGSTIVFHTTN